MAKFKRIKVLAIPVIVTNWMAVIGLQTTAFVLFRLGQGLLYSPPPK